MQQPFDEAADAFQEAYLRDIVKNGSVADHAQLVDDLAINRKALKHVVAAMVSMMRVPAYALYAPGQSELHDAACALAEAAQAAEAGHALIEAGGLPSCGYRAQAARLLANAGNVVDNDAARIAADFFKGDENGK